jgi:phosphatidate phosphatase LPIN
LGINWHFEHLVPLYNKLEELGYKIIYLTARSMTEVESTRKYLLNVKENDKHLPLGGLLMYPKSLLLTYKSDLITKNSDVYKAKMLLELKKAFGDCSEVDNNLNLMGLSNLEANNNSSSGSRVQST